MRGRRTDDGARGVERTSSPSRREGDAVEQPPPSLEELGRRLEQLRREIDEHLRELWRGR